MQNNFFEDNEDDIVVPAEDVVDESVPCPIHGEPLELKAQDGKTVGICQCNAPKNSWKGQTVYEKAN